jgi:hypothetical protein
MNKLYDSLHFVPGDALPEIEDGLSPRDVFKVLEAHPSGGFVLTNDGVAQCYVKAAELAGALQRLSADSSSIWDSPMSIVVERVRETDPIVPVDPLQVSADEEESRLTAQPPKAFRVADSSGRIGWFLNHESLRVTQTRRVRFVCDGKEKHKTYDPDHGDCPKCRGRLSIEITQI